MSRAPSSAGQGVGLIDEVLSSPALDAVREVAQNIDNFLTVIENTDEILGAQAGAEAAETAAIAAKTAAETAENDAEIHQATAANNAVQAINARNAAQAAQTAAETAQAATIVARDAALVAETNAENAAAAAAVSAASIVHASGTYAPVIGTLSNVTSAIINHATYSRIGNIVTVSFLGVVDIPGAGLSAFEISLPIASNLGSIADAHGTCFCQASTDGGYIAGNTVISEDNVEVVFTSIGPSSGSLVTGIFQYEIK